LKNTLIRNLSANTIQLTLNQLLGLVIFYLLSTGLDKGGFGQLNLALAILLIVFNLLSLGIDQVTIRKIALGASPGPMLSLYLFHVMLTGLLFYIILFTGSFFINLQSNLYPLLLLIGLGKLMIYFSTPFKQAASGLEHFSPLAFMLTISNIVRGGGLVLLVVLHILSLKTIIVLFVAGDMLELMFCIYLFKRVTKLPVKLSLSIAAYKALLREALPQMGVVFITSAMSRFDWIFIGFAVSAIKLAEYSFAYKVFEMSTLPLLAIAPLLLPWFTRLFKQDNIDMAGLKLLLKGEMIIAALTIVLLNTLWSPVVDALTGGKYGAVNTKTIFMLSLCLPFLYLNNFLWTIHFANGRLKMILKGFIITLLVNVVLDVVLVPVFKNEGAAAAFLVASIVQSVFYMVKYPMPGFSGFWFNLPACILCAAATCALIKAYPLNTYITPVLAVLCYFLLLFITTQLRPADYRAARKLLRA
jgi:O-antigen/teichoic acid export membrane protein